MNQKKWLMPMYYPDFKCKGDKCRHSCCHGWKIPISQDEYYRLVGMECSKELHQRIEIAFSDPDIVTQDCFKYISFDWLGECKLNKNGLCLIHAEKGLDELPKICKLYPRSQKEINGQLLASCSSSCERVVEMLFETDSLKMISQDLDLKPQIHYSFEMNNYDELKKFTEILKDRSTTLVDSIKEICLLVNKEEFLKDYNSDYNPLMEGLNLLNRFNDSNDFFSIINQEIQARYFNNYQQFEIDRLNFEKAYPNWMFFFENVINNSLIYNNFPFVDSRFDKTNAYRGLCACYGLMRLISIAYTNIHQNKEALIDSIAELFHLIDHTSFYYNVNVICRLAALLLKL